MDKLEPPQAFLFDSNVSHSWKLWLKHFDFYLAATEEDTKGDKIKTSIFLTCFDQRGREIYETFTFESGGELNVAPILYKFSEYCNPKKNITILRHKFFTYSQQESQNFQSFVTEVKKLSSEWEFDKLQDSLIKDMIVCGIKDNSLRERFPRECDFTLSKAISACHAAEETRKYAREILRSQPTADIDKNFKKKLNKSSHNIRNQNTRDLKKFKFCNSSHPRGKYSAYGKVCHVCNKKSHFKVCCPHFGKKVHEIEKDESYEPSDQSDYKFFIETINIQDSAHTNQIMNENSVWSITLTSNTIPVSCKIDTRAQCNVIPLTILKTFDPEPDFCLVNIKLFAYNNSKIPVIGKCSLTLKHKKSHFDFSFIAVDSKSATILELATSENLNLIKRISGVNVSDEQLLSEFSDCFGNIGTRKNTHHIENKDNVTPVVTPVRKIPIALKPKLEKELKRMVDLDIIEPVQKPTDWVNGLVVVEKRNGKLRVCLDPRPLNKAIKREDVHLPTAEEIFSQMSAASYFSKADASPGYLQIKSTSRVQIY